MDPSRRLSCYDKIFIEPLQLHKPADSDHETENLAAAYLERTWELSEESKTGQFRFRPYQPNSILLWRGSDNPNSRPSSPTQPAAAGSAIMDYELSYQLSFKTKLLQNILDSPLDLWFAYTQQSYWQIYSSDQSSPFRETNYEPELILNIPMHESMLGLNMNMLNIGLSHQSNGRGSFYSRSWNRVYVQAAFERHNFLLSLRLWQRINETASNDDNPDITSYMGNGDIRATWIGDESAVTALVRHTLEGNKGAFKLNWSFPFRGHLKGYAELFTGFGDTLIDYNHNHNTIGLGLLISTWP